MDISGMDKNAKDATMIIANAQHIMDVTHAQSNIF